MWKGTSPEQHQLSAAQQQICKKVERGVPGPFRRDGFEGTDYSSPIYSGLRVNDFTRYLKTVTPDQLKHPDHLPISFSKYALNLRIRKDVSRLFVKYILIVIILQCCLSRSNGWRVSHPSLVYQFLTSFCSLRLPGLLSSSSTWHSGTYRLMKVSTVIILTRLKSALRARPHSARKDYPI